ncbi:hypothetical protein F5Y17DRAFT_268533 [Xylariaceae sp. FL0594]|nr:hypothetical protein F5Y17DRAFT_268533 [Xylariaceae sp. FL0594]
MVDFRLLHPHDYEAALKYEFITELSPRVWKISRKKDRMEFLAQDATDTLFARSDTTDLTPLGELLAPGGHNLLHQVKLVLNHPNLVSLVDCFRLQIASASKHPRDRLFTVWDYCDAGNLGNLFVPPLPESRVIEEDVEMEDGGSGTENKQTSFLPESFCWHVLTSLLRALAWLHDGISEVVEDEDGVWRRLYENMDWQPILHRDISPQNIFLGHPRRREWYGPVRLGNYGSLVVSGHCQTIGLKTEPTGSKAMGPPPGESHARLADLIAWDAKNGALYPHQPGQPYTMVSEYRAVGEIIQAMMVEPTSNDHMEMIQSQSTYQNLKNAKYTPRLKNFIGKLMELDPWAPEAKVVQVTPPFATSKLYTEALQGVKWFMQSGKDEVDAYVTDKMAEQEDILERDILEGRRVLDSHLNVLEILERLS